MGATYEVIDRWECDTKPEKYPGLSAQALMSDKPPPVWRVIVSDAGRTKRIRVVAHTEHDAIERVKKELPHVVIVIVEPVS